MHIYSATYLVLHDELERSTAGLLEQVARSVLVIIGQFLLLLLGQLHISRHNHGSAPHVAQACSLWLDGWTYVLRVFETHTSQHNPPHNTSLAISSTSAATVAKTDVSSQLHCSASSLFRFCRRAARSSKLLLFAGSSLACSVATTASTASTVPICTRRLFVAGVASCCPRLLVVWGM